MKKNVGRTDKIIRVVLGFLLITLGVLGHNWWGLLGAGILLPAIMGSDPLYSVIGVDTNKV